ncbi:MAG: AAA family ATPase [Pseudomonadota bacterium]
MSDPTPDSIGIYLSGLPASGKTTLARYLSEHTGIGMLDKDDFLESLFDQEGVGDAAWRQKLSRDADILFQQSAIERNTVILVSHWRPCGLAVRFGTPCEWLERHFSKIIEIYCECSVEEAAQRFTRRSRHPGHVDGARSQKDIARWLSEYAGHLPIGIGKTITIDNSQSQWKEKALRRLRSTVERQT